MVKLKILHLVFISLIYFLTFINYKFLSIIYYIIYIFINIYIPNNRITSPPSPYALPAPDR